MAAVSGSSSIPFTSDGLYTGSVEANLILDKGTGMIWANVTGERLCLEPFQGKYSESFRRRFISIISADDEFKGLKKVFQDPKAVEKYGSGKTKSDDEIEQFIERDSKRAHDGNPFTGYAIIDRESKTCIGRISADACYEPEKGDSQVGLILAAEHRGEKKSTEAVVLLAALISILVKQEHFKVGGKKENSSVKRITATTRDDKAKMKAFITSYGLKAVRPLVEEENYSEEPRTLYAIDAKDVEAHLRKLMTDDTKLRLKYTAL